MTPAELQAAYFKGHGPVYTSDVSDPEFATRLLTAHVAGLAEVARQQAELDAEAARAHRLEMHELYEASGHLVLVSSDRVLVASAFESGDKIITRTWIRSE